MSALDRRGPIWRLWRQKSDTESRASPPSRRRAFSLFFSLHSSSASNEPTSARVVLVLLDEGMRVMSWDERKGDILHANDSFLPVNLLHASPFMSRRITHHPCPNGQRYPPLGVCFRCQTPLWPQATS